MEFFSDHPDVFIYLALVVLEQVLLLAPGSWPYRYGFPVRFIRLGLSFDEVKNRLAASSVRLHNDIDESRKEICFRNVFPLWTWSPLFLVAQAQFENRGRVIIRMAPLSTLGVIYLFLDAVGTFRLPGLGTALLLALLLAWYYRWMITRLKFLL